MTSFFKQKKRAVITNNPATFEANDEEEKAFTATPKTEKEKALLINALKDHYVFSARAASEARGPLESVDRARASFASRVAATWCLPWQARCRRRTFCK